MPSMLKTAAVTSAIAIAFSLSTPGKAFAVWCQADAPNVYLNMVTKFMPFVSNILDTTGLSIEETVVQAGAAVRAEVTKAATAHKAVLEGLAAYEQEQILGEEAANLSAAMRQPVTTCQAMASADSLRVADLNTQVSAGKTQAVLLDKFSVSGTTSALAKVETNHKLSNARFCTPEEEALKICQVSNPKFAGADRDATFLFQGPDGSSSFESGTQQVEAVDSYITRTVSGVPPQALSQQGEAFYKQNPKARAYIELSRRYNAMQSAASYSLAQIKELHRTQPGLGTDTMLSTVDAPNFAPNKADMSMSEAVERFVATKFSAKSVQDMATSTAPNLILREMLQMESFRLWMSYQGMRNSQRVESLQAHQLALLTEQVLRPQLDAQRHAAVRSNVGVR